MQFIDIPESPRLRDEKAVEAPCNVVDELEKRRSGGLTDKQTTVLIKFAKGLISSIEAEKQLDTSEKEIKEMAFMNQLRKTIMKYKQDYLEHMQAVAYGS